MTIYVNRINQLQPLHDSVLVADMNFHERFTSGGILIPGDDGKSSGVRPRWARIIAVGPDQEDVQVGQYVLVSHGRWTRGVTVEDSTGQHVIRKVDPNDILLVSDQAQTDDSISDKV